jgi:TetR/AcrR family transcriptional repressor of nem operon
MSARQERKGRTHSAILVAATDLLRRRGVAGMVVADVMRQAGLTVGGFYAHFPSKDALVDDTIRRIGVLHRDRLFGELDEEPARARARVVLERYLSAANRDDDDGCALPSIVGDVATTAPAQKEALADVIHGFAHELGKLGVARATALGVIALMIGTLTLSRALRGTTLSDEILQAGRAVGSRTLSHGRTRLMMRREQRRERSAR